MSVVSPELREIVIGAVARAADLAASEIHDDLDLLDVGLDSLDFGTILIEVEQEAGAELPADVLDRLVDPGHIITVRHVLELLAAWIEGES
jgi:acyl carrier protein